MHAFKNRIANIIYWIGTCLAIVVAILAYYVIFNIGKQMPSSALDLLILIVPVMIYIFAYGIRYFISGYTNHLLFDIFKKFKK